MDCIYNHKMYH